MGRSMPDSFETMWSDLSPVGRSASSGGYFRQPWLSAERELAAWFEEQCVARGLSLSRDAVGNVVAWWGCARPGCRGHRVAPGLGAGRRRVRRAARRRLGPCGDRSCLRSRGFAPSRPLGVSVFVEEEGSRFGLACLGSRLATGAVSWEAARELRDRSGVFLADGLSAAGPVRARRIALCWRASRRSWSCTSSRAATWSTAPPPSGSRAGSGRTGGTATSSPAPPTTPAPRGWRTAPTRCSPTR